MEATSRLKKKKTITNEEKVNRAKPPCPGMYVTLKAQLGESSLLSSTHSGYGVAARRPLRLIDRRRRRRSKVAVRPQHSITGSWRLLPPFLYFHLLTIRYHTSD